MLPPYLPTAIGSSCALAFTNQNQAVVVKERVEVYEPMRHFVFAAPVNMAPVLCVAACELVGGHREQAIVAAAALHLLASSDNPAGNNSGRILRVMVEMTRAMGSQDVEMTYETYKKNEGGLHTCGAACGAILGGGSVEEIELSLNLQLLAMCDRHPVARFTHDCSSLKLFRKFRK
ncbi:hypothetical protein WN944_027068 [Citrus x changshan-huyou]|uniref:Uncharacterized protein n=1 Tax=Citrus x changshan-huyou TaxID=2935761 RepID=A0AAP0LHX9_9ROSI